jgi:uncharacterized protein
MPVTTSYPGIYIEELPSSSHTITAAPTSVTVFIGNSHPFKTTATPYKPVEIFSFTDYENSFGGFFRGDCYDAEADLFGDLAQSVNQFFLNGGADAYVVALPPPSAVTAGTAQIGPLVFTALELTDGTHQMKVTISNVNPSTNLPYSYSVPFSGGYNVTCDVTITYGPPDGSTLPSNGSTAETYRQVSLDPQLSSGKSDPNYILTRIGVPGALVSNLATVGFAPPTGSWPQPKTSVSAVFTPSFDSIANPMFQGLDPSSGNPINGISPVIFSEQNYLNVFQQDGPLDKVQIFNLMVIPGVTDNSQGSILSTAIAFCERKRAFMIMDSARKDSADGTLGTPYQILIEDTMEDNVSNLDSIPKSANAALYFPYLTSNDPISGLATNPVTGQPYEIPPSGTVAGIFASTDQTRGVWKAPAGYATTLTNVSGVVERGQMTDMRQGVLNNDAINALRAFPGIGVVVFGARTSAAQNPAFQQWKYVPVRRTALFIEQTLYANLGWAVFEPNDVPLWTALRTSIEQFMLTLFNQQAFQGSTPSQAFQVKCDNQTTTQTDIDNGVVNIVVAFAPLKPAEFVVIQITQLAGQTQTS